ncbi:MAG: serine/threonine protein kinase [Elainella sp.]
MEPRLHQFITEIQQGLLPRLQIKSLHPHHPVVVDQVPSGWQLLGAGNYAAVFCHPDYPDWVTKIYASGRPGIEAEADVYRHLGCHPAFSECFYADQTFLVLKRLHGTTLYDCMHLGKPIPPQVIRDIDQALSYAQQQGLYPHDVHGRNVMMWQGRGLVVDVSDFLHNESCSKWQDLKRAYYWLYLPIFSRLRLKLPYFLLDGVRIGYRVLRGLVGRAA